MFFSWELVLLHAYGMISKNNKLFIFIIDINLTRILRSHIIYQFPSKNKQYDKIFLAKKIKSDCLVFICFLGENWYYIF